MTTPTQTLSDSEWLQAIVNHIDTVGWTIGTTYNHSGRQCLVGGAGAVEGIDYSSKGRDIFGYLIMRDDETVENAAAVRVAGLLEGNLSNDEWNTWSAWMAVASFNDNHDSWSDLRAKLVAKIEELRSGPNNS